MILIGSIYYHSKINKLVEIKRYKEGSNIATFFYLNEDLTRVKFKFYFQEIDKIRIGNIKYLQPFENKKQLKLF